MPVNNYLDAHPRRGAFVANMLDRLADLISEQSELLLQDAGLAFPARAVSTVLLIGDRGAIAAADIAAALQQPHQLVTQRVDLLIAAGVVERFTDPADARRKVLRLTPKGVDQFERLQVCLAQADRVFAALFKDLGCDLPAVALSAIASLEQSPVVERIRSLQDAP